MEEKHEEVEDVESASGDSFIIDSDALSSIDYKTFSSIPTSANLRFFSAFLMLESLLHAFYTHFNAPLILQEPLTEQEIEEINSEFLEIESKVAEAQKTLEKESLAEVESEVRDKLAQTLQGDDLDKAVAEEMATFKAAWEGMLDELETESVQLLEQLDGAGIELPSLYKWIESQVPEGCSTEAWRRRAHWVGSQCKRYKGELYFLNLRPLPKLRVLDLGMGNMVDYWRRVKKLSDEGSQEQELASVYLANNPQEAALLGLKFPGVDEVEEIEDIDASPDNPLVADAIENERSNSF
ncbi:chromatin remodeling complex subunit [Corchorus capsularis]|uniref:Chromatin remodeling complex subunit n=1 Tax=Corchorus capsularis TaxID=210143 RepID=A0A1R3GWI1_COCAP|nr:chromatin remodeling complex subunit [Corchorus capsularis]